MQFGRVRRRRKAKEKSRKKKHQTIVFQLLRLLDEFFNFVFSRHGEGGAMGSNGRAGKGDELCCRPPPDLALFFASRTFPSDLMVSLCVCEMSSS
jgi:hypothetical protein